jgi:hypothetical protein
VTQSAIDLIDLIVLAGSHGAPAPAVLIPDLVPTRPAPQEWPKAVEFRLTPAGDLYELSAPSGSAGH